METPHYFTEDGTRRIGDYVLRGEAERPGYNRGKKIWAKRPEIAVFRCTEATNETAIEADGDWPITVKARLVSTIDGHVFSNLATGCDNGGGTGCIGLIEGAPGCPEFGPQTRVFGPYPVPLGCGEVLAIYKVVPLIGESYFFTACERYGCLSGSLNDANCTLQQNCDPPDLYIPCGCCPECDAIFYPGEDCPDQQELRDEDRDEAGDSVILGLQEFDVNVAFMVGCPLQHEHFLAINRGDPSGEFKWYGFGFRHFAVCGPKSTRETPNTLFLDPPCGTEIPFIYLNDNPPSPVRDPGNRHLATWVTALRKYVVMAFGCQDEDCDDIAESIG